MYQAVWSQIIMLMFYELLCIQVCLYYYVINILLNDVQLEETCAIVFLDWGKSIHSSPVNFIFLGVNGSP